jgi:hypothetical protein
MIIHRGVNDFSTGLIMEFLAWLSKRLLHSCPLLLGHRGPWGGQEFVYFCLYADETKMVLFKAASAVDARAEHASSLDRESIGFVVRSMVANPLSVGAQRRRHARK